MTEALCTDDTVALIRDKARWMRRRALEMVYAKKLGHIGGDFSATDIVATLYFGVLRYDPENPDWPDRDRFIMSKGHATGVFCTALAAAGYWPEDLLETYMGERSRLNGHPNRQYLPGVEANTGPLGHGFPIALGIALGAKLAGGGGAFRTYVLTGDGEQQEGSNWAAAMTAGHNQLANLTLIIDRNRLQQGQGTEETTGLDPLGDKYRASASRRSRWMAMTTPRSSACSARPWATGKAALRHRKHHQGQGRELHGRLREVAPRGAQHRTIRTSDEGTGVMAEAAVKHALFDCRKAWAATIEALAAADDRITVVANDSIGSSNLGGFGAAFPDRLVTVGIAEQNMVGVSAGLANAGHIPFVSAASCFLTGRALEQIKADIAYSGYNVKLVGQSSGIAYGELGATHHSIEDFAWLRVLGQFTVIVPAAPYETA